MTALGDLIESDDRTVLVLGQELDVEHDQPDVANTLVHRESPLPPSSTGRQQTCVVRSAITDMSAGLLPTSGPAV
ncbi:hypothetical protein [Streptomyces sp. ISL-94]|uniref:hypothetical protein n=1 Tax=Streptomyces sp. ISL-94 TaxID=2819190 RepID=UPI001BEADEFC|nr:hypothetical protein [Streptomyces sp. ISL-94]MBT2482364.1 hypothetical protein [Streptomyces sp. ISL-94]